MFERFTDRARRILVLAQEIAVTHRNDQILPEHLLAGIVFEGEGAGAIALQHLGVDLERMEAMLSLRWPEKVELPKKPYEISKPGTPFSPMTKKLLELSLREALQLGHNYIGTEHLLLGIIREGENDAAKMLHEDFGLDLSEVRQQVVQLLAAYSAADRRRRGEPPLDDADGPRAAIAYIVTFPSRGAVSPLLTWLEGYASQYGPLASDHPVTILQDRIAQGKEIA